MAALLAAVPCCAADLPAIGEPPPGLMLPDLQGRETNPLSSSGKPVIIAFVTSWSKSCQTELNDLQELALKSGSGLEITAISFDKKIKTISDYVAGRKLSFCVLIDKKLTSMEKYSIQVIPTTYAIGADGKIKSVFVDYDDNVKKSLENFLENELPKK
jgi:peroxiredoxin